MLKNREIRFQNHTELHNTIAEIQFLETLKIEPNAVVVKVEYGPLSDQRSRPRKFSSRKHALFLRWHIFSIEIY